MRQSMQKPFENILIVVNGRSKTTTAVNTGLGFAMACNAVVHALYIVDTRSEVGHWDFVVERRESDGERAVEEVAERGGESGIDVIKAIRYGTPNEAILSYATDHEIDLIVIHEDPRTGIRKFTRGENIPAKILHKASVPVLTVRSNIHPTSRNKAAP